MYKRNILVEISGSKKYIQWLQTYEQKNKKKSLPINLNNDKFNVLLIEFEDYVLNYGIVFIKDIEPDYIALGMTYDSYNGEYRSLFMPFSEIQELYYSRLESFHMLENIIYDLIDKKLINIVTINVSDGVIDFTYLNIMFLAIVININAKNIINDKIEHNVNDKFIKLINFIYNHNNCIISDPFIVINNKFGVKIIPIEDNGNVKYNELVEIDINKKVSNLVLNNNAVTFPIYINFYYIQPVSSSCFNNTYLQNFYKKNDNIKFFIKDIKELDDTCKKNIKTTNSIILINQYTGPSIINFNEYDLIKEYHIFELMYGIYSLHINNILHGNVNINNITYSKDFNKNNGVDIFILSELGQCDTVIFNSENLHLYIIDFSCSVINTDQIFNIMQQDRIKKIASKYIDNLIIPSFSILCLIDYIDLTNSLLSIFTKIGPIHSLIVQVNELVTELFYKNINNSQDDIKDIEISIFTEIFKHNIFNESITDQNINNIYHY